VHWNLTVPADECAVWGLLPGVSGGLQVGGTREGMHPVNVLPAEHAA
jgi:hypothetical protein